MGQKLRPHSRVMEGSNGPQLWHCGLKSCSGEHSVLLQWSWGFFQCCVPGMELAAMELIINISSNLLWLEARHPLLQWMWQDSDMVEHFRGNGRTPITDSPISPTAFFNIFYGLICFWPWLWILSQYNGIIPTIRRNPGVCHNDFLHPKVILLIDAKSPAYLFHSISHCNLHLSAQCHSCS